MGQGMDEFTDGTAGQAMADEHFREEQEQAYYDAINRAKLQYRSNQRAHNGTSIKCAWCCRRILKKSYQTQFCSNKGKGNCKDKYWNNVDDTRRVRAQMRA